MVEARRTPVADGPAPAGDIREQFTTLYRRHYRGVVGMVVLLGGNREEAEDAAQRAFEDALRKWDTIRAPSAWVRVAARNHFIKARTRDRNLRERAIELHQSMRSEDEAEQDPMTRWVDLNWIEQVLAELPPGQRQILRYIFDGLSTRQIAELLGKNEPNVRSHLRHARSRLRERLAQAAPRGPVLPEPGKEESQ
ncbi:RNA polymerase sigma factor [Actinomadura xylanilytica]|uniref:RNA polymerase sigma factor n=1 Tax=Actinomadura xylanilytica TaxID=887459 RepID=UPI00255ABB68|nr:sigma-70 family RNA polymerase sigma factor [Actinomadura xylanilytica]MDL4773889.1 sigma-70 family RNA polymerase sigma factor [Actinomadura xylanilytica]